MSRKQPESYNWWQ